MFKYKTNMQYVRGGWIQDLSQGMAPYLRLVFKGENNNIEIILKSSPSLKSFYFEIS